MKFDNLEKYLDYFADKVGNDYKSYLANQNYNIANTISTRVELFGNVYSVYMNLADYWKYIEYGRPPGKRPPINAILKWIQQKGITPRSGKPMSQKSLAFLIARKIGRDGIKPRPVLFPQIIEGENFNENVVKALQKDVQQYIKDIKNNII